jgi:uncharacterized protein YhdP
LQLDFSDLYKNGFIFDFLKATLTLNEGYARTQNMWLDGPSAAMYLKGYTRFSDKEINLQLDVTPKVSGGLSVAAAVAAGNPVVGAGVWLFDTVWGEKLRGFTQFHYQIDGSWDKPLIIDLGQFPREIKPKPPILK